VRLLERARLLVGRAGEGALLVAEQQVLEDLLRERGAVEGVERPLGALALLVQGARDELLAGAALAEDEHRGVGRARRARSSRRPCASRRSADELAEVREPLDARLELAVLLLELGALERLGMSALTLASRSASSGFSTKS
jgi:hypothetical protein